MPTTVIGRAPIPLPLDVCWQKLRDLTRAVNYVPGLTACVVTTEAREGVGASRCVTSKQFGDMDETVIAWDEGAGFTIRLHKGEKPATPFREATFRYALEAVEDGCEIVTTMKYELGFGPLGTLLDALLFRRISQGNMRKVATALAEHYLSDAPVSPERLDELLKQSN